jgi:hypothetical protein
VRHRGEPRCLGEWGRRLELGLHRRRQWWTAAARVEARVRAGSNRAGLYGRWKSVRRSWDQPRRRCMRGVGNKALRCATAQAANGVRRLARRRVETGHLAPSKSSRSSPTVACRRGAWTAGSASASACARDARTAAGMARARDVVRGRALAFPGCWHFADQFSNLFFSKFSD